MYLKRSAQDRWYIDSELDPYLVFFYFEKSWAFILCVCLCSIIIICLTKCVIFISVISIFQIKQSLPINTDLTVVFLYHYIFWFSVFWLPRTTKIIFFICSDTHFARQDRKNGNLKNKQNHATKVTKIQKRKKKNDVTKMKQNKQKRPNSNELLQSL